jgi:hypothetical protein
MLWNTGAKTFPDGVRFTEAGRNDALDGGVAPPSPPPPAPGAPPGRERARIAHQVSATPAPAAGHWQGLAPPPESAPIPFASDGAREALRAVS